MSLWAPRCGAKPRLSRSTEVGGERHHVLLGTRLRCKTTRFAQYGGGWRAAPCPYGLPAAHQNHAFRAVQRWVAGGTMPFWAPRCAATPRVSRSTAVGGGRHHALLGTPLRCKTTRFAQYGGGRRAAPCRSGHPAALQNHAFRAVRRWVAGGTMPLWRPAALQNHAFHAVRRWAAGGTMPLWRPAALLNHAFRAVRRWAAGGHHALMAPRCAAKPRVSRSTAVGGGRAPCPYGAPLRCKTTRFAQYGGGRRAAPCPYGAPL